MSSTDTIAAIASGMTASGIGIIRISGPEAFITADRICRLKNGKKVSEMKPNSVHYGFISDGNEEIDEALVLVMKAPHTYTAEDTVEIDCHGGPYAMAANHLSQSMIDLGIRLVRFKTGTPARIDGRTIDYDKMTIQPGDREVVPFSFSTDPKDVQIEQVPCWLTYTNEKTHDINDLIDCISQAYGSCGKYYDFEYFIFLFHNPKYSVLRGDFQ